MIENYEFPVRELFLFQDYTLPDDWFDEVWAAEPYIGVPEDLLAEAYDDQLPL